MTVTLATGSPHPALSDVVLCYAGAGLTEQEYGPREFAARDPHGNVWCFGAYRPSAG